MKIHSSCEIEDFVATHLCKLCVIIFIIYSCFKYMCQLCVSSINNVRADTHPYVVQTRVTRSAATTAAAAAMYAFMDLRIFFHASAIHTE